MVLAPSLETEGFIHCSFKDQLAGTAAKHYEGQTGLLILEIDESLLSAELVIEDSYGSGAEFPHVYGPIESEAVRRVIELLVDTNGQFAFAVDHP